MIRTVNHRGQTFQIHDDNEHTAWVCDQLPLGWETDTYETIDQYVNGGVFIDVGAWIGLFTIYAAQKASAVVAFEPDPVAYDMLVRNIEANGLEGKVWALNKALWEHDNGTTLRVQGELGDSMTGPNRPGTDIHVDTYSVARLRYWFDNPDLVKIDTEGSEGVLLPLVRNWMVPIHLSVHLPELRGPLDYGDRKHVQLTPGGYHTVFLEP